MYKTLPVIAVGTLLLLGGAGTSYAADSAAKQPLDQAIKSVDKNLAKDPDNKGLNNAAERLQTNQERHNKKRAAQLAKRHEKREMKMEKRLEHERTERPEKAERPEKVERPEKPARP